MSTVLVTGGSGFVGSHCILQLLGAGHAVRTTVRNWPREPEVRAMLRVGGRRAGRPPVVRRRRPGERRGLARAVAGCEYVLHVASPFPLDVPKNEDELIVPAREGALRVLRAARDAGVKRVVLTSSFAAIGYGHRGDAPFDETSWTDPTARGIARLREVEDHRGAGGVGLRRGRGRAAGVGGGQPGRRARAGAGAGLLDLDPARPAPDGGRDARAPKAHFGLVDVRDVADLHMRAMTDPAAKGERFLAMSGKSMSIRGGPGAAREDARGVGESADARGAELDDQDDGAVQPRGEGAVAPAWPADEHQPRESRARPRLRTARARRNSILATAKSLIAQEIVKA